MIVRTNVAGQVVGCQMVAAADGSAFTSTVSVFVTIDGGTQASGGGTVTHEGNGYHSYAPTQAETNGVRLAYTFTGSGAVPRTVHATGVSFNPADAVRLGLTALPNAAAEAAGGLYTRGSGAGQINQDANGRVDTRWVTGNVTVGTNSDKTGYALSTAGIQALWDALTSALTTVGSIGKLLVDNVNATISSRATQTSVDAIDDFVDTEVAAILAAVDTEIGTILSTLGSAGAGLTAVPWNAAWDAEVQSEVQDAIEANHLDHLLAVTYDPASKPGAADALLNELVESDAGVARYTANALEQAPSGGGGVADWTADERTAIRAILGVPTSGTTPDDPTTGILDTIRDNVATKASQTSVDDLPTNAELATALGTADDATLAAISALDAKVGTPSNLGGGATLAANLSDIEGQTDDIGVAGAGLTAVPWNAAWDAEVESEVTDALVALNLDHLLGTATGIPSVPSGTFWDQMLRDGTATYDRTTDSLQALRDRGDAAWTTVAAAAIRSAVGLAAANLDAQLAAIDDYIDTEIADILTDTSTTLDDLVDEIESRLTAALASKLAAHAAAVLTFTTTTGGTTTTVPLSTVEGTTPSAVDDFYNGAVMVFTSGALAGQRTSISDYNGTTKVATVVALTSAPASGVSGVIV